MPPGGRPPVTRAPQAPTPPLSAASTRPGPEPDGDADDPTTVSVGPTAGVRAGTRTPERSSTGSEPAASRSVRTANLVHRPAPMSTLIAIGSVVLVLLVLLPGYLVLRQRSENPAFTGLDNLAVPTWAARNHHDHVSGSRWCVAVCLISERTWDSTRAVDETASVYALALRQVGWEAVPTKSCPGAPGVTKTCWLLDQNELDLTVGRSICAGPEPPETEPGLPNSVPRADPTNGPLPPGCAETTVHAKVFNRITPAAGR